MGVGVVCVVIYLLRRWLQSRGSLSAVAYMPVVGGLLEIGVLYLFFRAMLQSWRTQRPLQREPWLFVGLLLALIPPAVEFFGYVARWTPG